MSYTLETLGNPSYRKLTETRSGYSRASGSPSSGFRSQSWSRSTPSTISSSYKRSNVAVPRGYSSTVLSSSDSLDFSQSSVINGDLKYSRANEKEQLQGLNDRFAGYIDKVHFLEQQNKEIENEIRTLRQKQATHSQLGDVYDQEIRELRAILEQVNHEKAQIQLDTDHIEEDIQRLKDRYEEELRLRDDTEVTMRTLKKDMEDASLIKVEFDKKVQSLQDEVAFLRNNHEEEVTELLSQIQASRVTVERKDYLKPDISSALKEIRTQLECHSDKNMQQTEDWFKCRYVKLTEAAEQNKEAIRSAKEEITEYRRQLQSKSVELESARGTKESLERQINDIEERHNHDLASYQDTIQQLDNELRSTKWEMARHLREYQDLLNVKMALDIEIAAYRKLLEGEETRFSTFSGSITGPSFTQRQPPVTITSSIMQKSKAEPPKLKVQHKFVEEIIEETKVEDESSEMDDALAAIAEELAKSASRAVKREREKFVEEKIVAAVKTTVEAAAPEAAEEEEEEEEGGEKEEEVEEVESDKAEEGSEKEVEEGEAEKEGSEGEADEGEKEDEAAEEKSEEEASAEEKEEAEDEIEEEIIIEKKIVRVKALVQEVALQEEAEAEEETEGEEKKGEDGEEEGEKEEGEEQEEESAEEQKGEEEEEETAEEEAADKEEEEAETAEEEDTSEKETAESPVKGKQDVEEIVAVTKAVRVGSKKEVKDEKEEEEEETAEGEGDESEKETEKEDTAVNGDIQHDDEEEEEEEERKVEEEDKGVVTNGMDESPSEEKEESGKIEERVVVTKTVEKITSGDGDGTTKYITKSVTVTEKVQQLEESFQERLVSSKKVETVTSSSRAVVKDTSETD